jgi:GT2 family glycosyltransferase
MNRTDTRGPEVVVALITYNSADVLSGCLDTLPAALEEVESFRVVVADNASSDDTLAVATTNARGLSVEVVQLGANLGYSAGINAVTAHAGSEGALLVVNPDIRFEAGAVRLLLDGLSSDVGITVPRTLDASGRLDPSLAHEPSIRRALADAVLGGRVAGRFAALGEFDRRPGSYDVGTRADWANGAALLISNACRHAVGPWDETFFLYAEEIDYCLRARDAGFATRLVPDAVVVHLRGKGEQSSALRPLQTYNKWRLYRRRHGAALGVAYRGALALHEALRTPRNPAHRAALRTLVFPARPPVQLRPTAHAHPKKDCQDS